MQQLPGSLSFAHSGDPRTQQAAAPALLRVSRLSMCAGHGGEIPLLESVSFDIGEGEFLALVGESGSGKSLMCSTLMGLLSAGVQWSGEIHLQGQPLGSTDRRSRAMIFQQPSRYLNPVRTIGFQLEETVRLTERMTRRDARERAESLLLDVGIKAPQDTMRKYAHEMSGGMNQRVMIALALARKPKLLIADEPTSALDVTTQKQIMDLLSRLRSEWNMGILFVTHDLGLAVERADRIGVLYAGQLVELGPADQLARHPIHPYTAALFSTVPDLSATPQRLHTLAGSVPDPRLRTGGCHFAARCPNSLPVCHQTQPDLPADLPHAAACHNVR